MSIHWRRAYATLSPSVAGYVERSSVAADASAIALPFATPIISITLDRSVAPSLCVGRDTARLTGPSNSKSTFVIALTFTGAAVTIRDRPAFALGRDIALDDHFWREFRDELLVAPDFARRAGLADRLLQPHFKIDAWTALPKTYAVADAVAYDRLIGSVASLAERAGLEERTFRNRIRHETGWSAKRLLRVARFSRVVRSLHPSPWSGNLKGDARLEYFDDPHLYRDFKALAGLSPRSFVAAKRKSGDQLLHQVSNLPPSIPDTR